jgi:hypothetical protein
VGFHKKLRSTYLPLLEEPSSCSTPKKHFAQDGLLLLGRGPIGPYPSLAVTSRLRYDVALRDSKGCVD